MLLKPLGVGSFVVAAIELFAAAMVLRLGWEFGFVLFRFLH